MESPAWQKRYRVQIPLWSALAGRAPYRGIVATNPNGIFQLHAWDVSSGTLRQATFAPQGVLFGSISPDGKYLYYRTEVAGNEVGHWVRVPFEGGPEESLTPDMPPFASISLGSSADGRHLGFNAISPQGISILVIDVDEDGRLGSRRELRSGRELMFGPMLSGDGSLGVIMSNARATGGLAFSLLAVDTTTGEQIAELWDGEGTNLEARMFSPVTGDERVLAQSNRSGYTRPLIWNPRTGERTDLNVDGLDGEVSVLDWSADGTKILLGQIHQATHRLYLYDVAGAAARRLEHPAGTWGWLFGLAAYFGPDGEIYAHYQDSTHPETLVSLDDAGNVTRTIVPAGPVPASRPWRSFTFPSGGDSIQGWLCVPDGDGPFPTILHTHGGPTAATVEHFDAECQAFIDHGFAFATINYHGSTTFGREFQESINGDLGNKEVADMIAARDWLVENAVAHPERIILAGRSYGGYLTLMGLGVRPDLWAGGLSGVPVVDWTMLYEDSVNTRAYAATMLKGTPETSPEQYRISSPLTYVDRVNAPVLILFGRNDARCPARPIDIYIERLRSRGQTVEVHEFQGGHLGAYTDAEEGIREQQLMLDFAQRILQTAGQAKLAPAT